MTDGEMAYLGMVLVFFLAFMLVIGKVSMESKEHR